MFDQLIEQMVSNSKNNGLIADFQWRKAEAGRVNRLSQLDSLEVGKKVDFRTKDYVWHSAVVKRLRFDPIEKKRMALVAMVVRLLECPAVRGRRDS